ncbi:MAG: hypothetical protein QNJ71_02975 [Acidimicrobiia bacterium]|nr:hypothetical protein [Acidimicrobiia bacterium]
MLVVLSIMVSVVLAAPFGEATAAAIDDEDGLAIEVSVEVNRASEAVLFRPFSTFEELPPTALRSLGDGTWGGVVVLPTAEDWFVVFELIEPDGATERSDTTTLVELGVDPVVVSGEPEAPVSSSFEASTWWLIVGMVLALGALGALAWWTFGTTDGRGEPSTPDDPEDPATD